MSGIIRARPPSIVETTDTQLKRLGHPAMGQRIDPMISANTANKGAGSIRADFVFETRSSEPTARQDFRTRRDSLIKILRPVKALLATKNFEVTEPGPGKGYDAGFKVIFDSFKIFAAASVVREHATTLECVLATIFVQSRRHHASKASILVGWSGVADVIAHGLESDPNVISVKSLTKEESRSHPAFHPSTRSAGQA